ncbi:MAG: beta-propeller fold lactonase family protein [Acidobacteriota bacterium]
MQDSSKAASAPRFVRLVLLGLVCALPVAASFLDLAQVVRDGVGGVDGLDGVSSVAVSPDGINVYAVANVDQSIAAFRRDVTADALVFLEALKDDQGGVFGLLGASDVAVSPDGAYVFVTAAVDDTLLAFRRDVTQESLSLETVLADNVGGVFGLDGATSVAVAPDGGHVFVASAIDDALTVFARDASTDDLTLVDFEQAGGLVEGPSSVAVRGDGERLFVASRDAGWISIFSRDPTIDDIVYDLSFRRPSTQGASDLALSGDAQRLYVTSAETDTLTVFRAITQPPFWAFDQLFTDGQDGVDGLDGASAVALSPSGGLLFVAGSIDDGVAIFRVLPDGLEYVQTVLDGVDGVDGLDGALALAVSPDALHVYVAGSEDDAITGLRLLEILFFDDFESGGLGAWSATIP